MRILRIVEQLKIILKHLKKSKQFLSLYFHLTKRFAFIDVINIWLLNLKPLMFLTVNNFNPTRQEPDCFEPDPNPRHKPDPTRHLQRKPEKLAYSNLAKK